MAAEMAWVFMNVEKVKSTKDHGKITSSMDLVCSLLQIVPNTKATSVMDKGVALE